MYVCVYVCIHTQTFNILKVKNRLCKSTTFMFPESTFASEGTSVLHFPPTQFPAPHVIFLSIQLKSWLKTLAKRGNNDNIEVKILFVQLTTEINNFSAVCRKHFQWLLQLQPLPTLPRVFESGQAKL